MKNLKAKLNAKKRKGFTIVELIVVMAIIAILTLIAVPTFSKFLDQADDTAQLADADSLYTLTMSEVTLQATLTTPDNLTVGNEITTSLAVNIERDANLDTDIVFKAYATGTTPTITPTENAWTVYIPVDGATAGHADPAGDIWIDTPKAGDDNFKNGNPVATATSSN